MTLKLEEYYGQPNDENSRMVRLPTVIPLHATTRKANIHGYKQEKNLNIIIFEIKQIDESGKETSLTWRIKPDELKAAIALLEEWQKGK